MTQMEIQAPTRIARNGYKVDVSRGQRIGRVSSEWFNRPDDERYLSLTDLHNSVKRRSERSKTRIVESEAIRVEATRDNPERLTLMLPDAHAPVAPTHWSFGQLASLVGAPATYLRQLPAAARRHQSAVRADLAPRRAGEDARNRERPPRASSGDRPGLRQDFRPRTGRGRAEDRRQRHRRHALESAGRARLVDGHLQPQCRYLEGHDDALCLRPRRLSSSWSTISTRSKPGGCRTANRISISADSTAGTREVGLENPRNCKLLSACSVSEPESLGRRRFRGNHHPALQICCLPLCRSKPSRR